MKLFSNTERQKNSNVNFQYRPTILEQNSNNPQDPEQNRPQSSKFSFRQDPTTNIMEAISKSDLFSRPSHIRIQNAEDEANHDDRVLAQQRRSLTPRKRIFDPDNLTVKLKQSIPDKIKPQVKFKSTQSSMPLASKKGSSNRYPSSSIQIGSINIPDGNRNSTLINQSKWNRGSYKPKLPIIFESQQENTKKILTEPILAEQRVQKDFIFSGKPQQRINDNQYNKIIPSLVERMDKNEKQIVILKDMMQKLMARDTSKDTISPSSMERQKWLMDRQRRLDDKQFNIDNRVQKIKQDHAVRSSLEQKQIKRLQQLIEQNRHLCEKVLEKRMRNSQEENLDTSKTLEAKILQLQEQRQALQRGNYSSYLHNLDISAIPYHHQDRQINSSHLTSYPFGKPHFNGTNIDMTQTNPTTSINSSIPGKRRDQGAQMPVRQVVKTKIY